MKVRVLERHVAPDHPQAELVFVEGWNGGPTQTSLPYQSALYVVIRDTAPTGDRV